MEAWMIADLVVAALIVICVFVGIKRGFIRAAYHIAALAATIFLVAAIQQPVTEVLLKSQVGDMVSERIQTSIDKTMRTDGEEVSISDMLKDSGLPGFLVDQLNTDEFDRAREDVALDIAESITECVIRVAVCIVLFLVIRLLLWILLHFLDKICELPVLHFANRMAGAAIGLLNAIVILYVVCALIVVLVPVDTLLEINKVVDQTMLVKWFYDHNMILNVLL